MGNTHGRRSVQGKKLRKRPHSIAVEKPETWSSSKPQLLRSASHGSIRRRYSESGNYSYKTPWPVPLSEAVFLPEYDSKQPVKISDFEVCWQKYKFKIASGEYKHLNNERRSTHFQYNCLLVLGNVSLWIRSWQFFGNQETFQNWECQKQSMALTVLLLFSVKKYLFPYFLAILQTCSIYGTVLILLKITLLSQSRLFWILVLFVIEKV